jgi:glycerol-3-phosphate dehydrogenase
VTDPYDVAIVGAGVVGTALARELAGYDLSCVLIDTAADVGTGTSKANTAILHTGFDATPGSLEARLVRRGYALLGDYAEQTGIAVERTGALLVAWDDEQLAALPGLAEKARRNGYTAIRSLTSDELYAREPHLGPGARGGLAVPDESIVDPWTAPLAFATEAVAAGVELRLSTRVTGVEPGPEEHLLRTPDGTIRARWLVNAAGLGSDLVDRMLGHEDFTVTPRRGELIVFDKLARPLVSSILLPVPTARGKGVLVAPTVFGNVLLGPTADDVDDRTDTATTADGLAGLREKGRRILPALLDEEVTATYAGLRAATEHSDYRIRVRAEQRYAVAGGIRSTGLSASMAIAEHLVELLEDAGLKLVPTARPEPPRMPALGETMARPYCDAGRIAADPAYGTIVCHCERVTAGELRDALTGPLPPADLDGLRRRTRAMNGRCQGFWCGADVTRLFAERSS